jgi:hypothetical protein
VEFVQVVIGSWEFLFPSNPLHDACQEEMKLGERGRERELRLRERRDGGRERERKFYH